MPSAMPTLELASSFRYHNHLYYHLNGYHKRIHIRFSLYLKQPLTVIQSKKSKWQSNPFHTDTYASLLQKCTNINALKQVHARMLINGHEQNVYLGTKLVNTYAKCHSLGNARLVFEHIYDRDVFVWNVMIREYARNNTCEETLILYHQMRRAGVQPNNFTFPFLLTACASLSALKEGKDIHDDIVRAGLESDAFVSAALVHMYGKCGSIENARYVFDKMSVRDVVSWNTMIAGYSQNGFANEALTLFNRMQLADMKPNPVTIVSVLPACAHLGALQQGKWIHAYLIRSGFESVVSTRNSLIAMYAKCGSVEAARQLFDNMSERDVVSWNAMIAGYVQNGHANEALTLFYQMQLAEVAADSVTFVNLLPACALLGALQQGKWIHDYVIRSGFESEAFVRTALIDMYAKCGSIEIARQLFDKMLRKDVISWSAMITGYAQNGHANEALTLFHQMQLTDLKPDLVTMVSLLQACAHLGALKQGKWIHDYVLRSGFESNVTVGNSLIDMYAKCGSIDLARLQFDKMPQKNVVSWSAMIAGYGMHGHGEDAVALFSQMQQTDMKPDCITFVCVLSACSHAGLVDEGWQYFECMDRDFCIKPRLEHYACMVDLLGRAGHLDEAQDFVKKMPVEPDAGVWGALLGACRIHCNIELGERVAKHLFHLEPKNAGYYVLLSNIYAAAGRWDDVGKVRAMMKDSGVKKTPGCSLIEVESKVHAFFVGDRSHPQSDKIYATLETLARQMEEAGYAPNTNFVLHDVEDEVKEHLLCIHSEKLAIAFGLINTKPGITIRITKNLRVCGDCHSATKFISKIVRREIIVRDANRFHHFKDGLCSCGDYW
eukprot:Gb_29877 [translate_table: standard]